MHYNDLVYQNNILTNRKDITSLSEYLDLIEIIKHSWKNKWLFYRGVSKSTYNLVPSIYRQNHWTYSKDLASEIFSEFKRKVSCFRDITNCSDWGYYELMQHYGLPTRLIDWSCGSLIAVFFSLLNLRDCDNPCIWVIDPTWLNKTSIKKDYVFSTENTESKSRDILEKYLYDFQLNFPLPIALLPTNNNPRIVAQKSAFTVHGTLSGSINQILKSNKNNRLCKITFANNSLLEIKRSLATSGINYSNIFPDITGLCNELKFEYQLE